MKTSHYVAKPSKHDRNTGHRTAAGVAIVCGHTGCSHELVYVVGGGYYGVGWMSTRDRREMAADESHIHEPRRVQ